jgi:protease I
MRIACLLDDGFQDSECQEPAEAFRQAGHEVTVIGFEAGRELRGHGGQVSMRTDLALDQARPQDFDALFIPGAYAPDRLRIHPAAVGFARAFLDSGKPALFMARSPQLLLVAGVVKPVGLGKEEAGARETVWLTVPNALQMRDADIVEREVVVDRNLVTAEKPEAIPAFVRESLSLLEQCQHATAGQRPRSP